LTVRIPIQIHLQPVDADQVTLYIRHRMNTAGYRRDVFGDDVLSLMSKATGSIMHQLCVVGDQWLIARVHHVRRNASPTSVGGYSRRGSGDLYAWLDSFLCLRMHQNRRTLSLEHRSAWRRIPGDFRNN